MNNLPDLGSVGKLNDHYDAIVMRHYNSSKKNHHLRILALGVSGDPFFYRAKPEEFKELPMNKITANRLYKLREQHTQQNPEPDWYKGEIQWGN